MNDTTMAHADAFHDKTGHPTGKGLFPSFPALWHLQALGVAESLAPFASAAWDAVRASGKGVRVAVIDTPVSWRHPNLVGAVDLGLARDFSVLDTGAFLVRDVTDPEDQASRAALLALACGGQDAILTDILTELGADGHGPGDDRSRFLPSDYGGHGTAVAGLIGARPGSVALRRPAVLDDTIHPSTVRTEPLPYAGINPFCRIVPISTTAAPDPGMVKGAIDYARLIRADVVAIAAAWADSIDRAQDPGGWDAVDDALRHLCETALVFCAAGNKKIPAYVYPASLSGAQGTPRPWAVTACDETGRLLGYAPEPLAGHDTICTLSSEAPRHDREAVLIDPFAARDPDIRPPQATAAYPERYLVSTDPPGAWGYRSSAFAHGPSSDEVDSGVHYEIGSLFCRFSGTSAATAIAAGLASLAIAMGPDGKPDLPDDVSTRLMDLTLARALFG
ncbi:MAG: S8 family serine peptidase [Rhodobacteraceae bacterium]|jgi:subtilisin family serine protease|nr:S8 family serine peptidase [Paracoccaceae bacterium]